MPINLNAYYCLDLSALLTIKRENTLNRNKKLHTLNY